MKPSTLLELANKRQDQQRTNKQTKKTRRKKADLVFAAVTALKLFVTDLTLVMLGVDVLALDLEVFACCVLAST